MSEAQAPLSVPPPALTHDEPMPRRFGKYTLLRKMAVGGMAELFLALHRSVAGFEKLVVIKRVLPELSKDEAFVKMLLREAQIAASLNHPNVAQTFDVGFEEGRYYIAMEHVHGEDLLAIVRALRKTPGATLPLEHALAIVMGAAAGLAHAHEHKDLDGKPLQIVHRDVSPQNIVVMFSGDVKVVDFGIAKSGAASAEQTLRGKLKGKAPYMSPEQAAGLPLDARTDIFSLGVIMFELCTGKRLFRGPNEFETLRMITEGEYPTPHSVNSELPAEIDRIIRKALARNRDERYASARELQADLEAFVRDERLVVSAISLGAWMRELFADRLAAQEQALREGKQLAEVLANEDRGPDPSGEIITDAPPPSGVRERESGRPRTTAAKSAWKARLVVVAAVSLAAALGYFVQRIITLRPAPTGSVLVETTPEGATVWLDGAKVPDVTPTRIEKIALGGHNLRITLSGHEEALLSTRLGAEGETARVRRTLTPIRTVVASILRVGSVPAGARVLLDGHDTGHVTPVTLDGLTTAEHVVTFDLDGWEPRTERVTTREGAITRLDVQLVRTPLAQDEAVLRVLVEPAEARVLFDQRWHDGVSPYEFRVPARGYRVVVAKTGYRSIERMFTLPGGRVTEMAFTLEREGGAPIDGESPALAEPLVEATPAASEGAAPSPSASAPEPEPPVTPGASESAPSTSPSEAP